MAIDYLQYFVNRRFYKGFYEILPLKKSSFGSSWCGTANTSAKLFEILS